MTWTHRFLLRFRFYRRFVDHTRIFILPGFYPLSLFDVLAFFLNEVQQQRLLNRASSLAFNFMLAFFPATIFLFTLIPYIPIKNFQAELLHITETILPQNAYQTFQVTLVDIISRQHGKLLSIGFISALYFATNGMINLMQAFNRSSLIVEKRSWWRRRGIALILTAIISLMLLVALTIMAGGEALINFLRNHIYTTKHFWIYIVALSRWIIVSLIFFATISILYRYGPANKQKWDFFNTGSVMATILALLTSAGFSYYINHFSSYNKIYGSIGTLIILMLWLNLNSLILIIGFELNASIDFSRRNIKNIKPMFNSFRPDISG